MDDQLQSFSVCNGEYYNADFIIENFPRPQAKHDQMLVEGIGGLMVPIKSDYLVSDLVKDVQLPLIIVSRVALGTLNHTLLTLKVARASGIEIAGIILNRQKRGPLNEIELEQTSLIQELSGIPVLGECPFIDPISMEQFGDKLAEKIGHWKVSPRLS